MPFAYPRKLNQSYASAATKIITLGVSGLVPAPKKMRRYKTIATHGLFVMQQRNWRSKTRPMWRICTKSKPMYMVAQSHPSDGVEVIRDREWKYICEDLDGQMPQMRKKKDLLKWYIRVHGGGVGRIRVSHVAGLRVPLTSKTDLVLSFAHHSEHLVTTCLPHVVSFAMPHVLSCQWHAPEHRALLAAHQGAGSLQATFFATGRRLSH